MAEMIRPRYEFGTKAALVRALSDVCPRAEVQEWFEYGADPYYFRVILDVTCQGEPISHSLLMRMVNGIRPARSLMQDDDIIFRTRNFIEICEASGYVVYTVRACGIHPKAATQGHMQGDIIAVDTDGDIIAYISQRTGDVQSGTTPSAATQGGIEGGNINFGSSGESTAYNARACGTLPGSLI